LTSPSLLDSLAAKLSPETRSRLVPGKSASVAVIFRNSTENAEVLLIRRAEREGDPWSGQAAFPGGMVSSADKSFEETARREAREEVGVLLSAGAAVFMGYMREFKAHTRGVIVVPSVFKLVVSAEVNPNKEVASFEWAPLAELTREASQSSYLIPKRGGQIPFPCIVHRSLVIWGLTEKILSGIIRS
jgi:8-oxo-dGTP pyrophosphatase MutT (NUDIX family)